jgi:hypothetical protein
MTKLLAILAVSSYNYRSHAGNHIAVVYYVYSTEVL